MEYGKLNGRRGEELAARFLERDGMKIVCRNFRCRQGEVDLVARDGEVLVFVEVKARSRDICGYPAEAVTKKKQRRICTAAGYYCLGCGIGDGQQIRFDVVEILGGQIRHIKNAFDYCGW